MDSGGNLRASIIIPLYNAESTIRACILSCIDQTYPNIEIIVVDDGSNDNSIQAVEDLMAFYKNIRLERQDRLGACAARNLGIKYASGKYIQYLDADDLLSPDKIEAQINILEQSGLETNVTFCRWFRFSESSKYPAKNNLKIYRNYSTSADWLMDSWQGGGAVQTACWLTFRKTIEQAGAWNESLKKNQDGEFFSRVLARCQQVLFSEQGAVYYRDSGKLSVSASISYSSAESTLRSIDLYSKNISVLNNPSLAKANRYNYSFFYKHYFPRFPDLLKTAEDKTKAMGFNKLETPPFIRGYVFYKLLGFKRGVKLLKALTK